MERNRIGVVEIRRDEERIWFVCQVCDTRTDFPFRPEMVDWAGRAFLFVHEHPDVGNEVSSADVHQVLEEYIRLPTAPTPDWPVPELNPLLPLQAPAAR